MIMPWQIETTDTFGGEANYSWCSRAEIDLPDNLTDRQTIRALRAAAGLTGSAARTVTMAPPWRVRRDLCPSALLIIPNHT
jgi:hypothetical protein